jgi:mTERF
MNSNRAFLLLKFVKNQQCLRKINLHKFSTSIEPVTAHSNLPETVNPSEDFLTFTSPTFNFAAYIEKSETLRKFVELGVDLSKIEKKKGLPQYVLQLDFERDIKKHLFFLHDLGLPADAYGYFLTKNPLIFKESIDDLETRVYYLRSKKFTVANVQEIVAKNPYWLSFSTKRIDRRLGWFQKNFQLDGNEMRGLTVKQPKLITYNMEHIREASFSVREQMGFEKDEMKSILLAKPNLWMNSELKNFVAFTFFSLKNLQQITQNSSSASTTFTMS